MLPNEIKIGFIQVEYVLSNTQINNREYELCCLLVIADLVVVLSKLIIAMPNAKALLKIRLIWLRLFY